ncbi:DGQHR domain-containing protein [Luteimonas sp. MJ204]|uniref:DGQHR domain-containing protein n=1 Tax=Luteimonas sp. MJ145 TaxID=3129234 RepID=UPI0031BA9281
MSTTFSIPVFPVRQKIGTFFTGVSSARDLLAICKFDFRRIHERGGRKEFLGIQRELKSARIKVIEKYIRTQDAVFPTSIVISVDEKCARLHEKAGYWQLELSEYVDPEDARLNIPQDSIATIIDGQHRLKSFENNLNLIFDLPVSIFIGIDDAIEATIFSTVNLAQTKVNKSLVYDLFSLDKDRSPEKTAHEIAVALDELENSPFKSRIKRLGTATEGRFGETLSQATVVKGILPYISRDPMMDRDIGKRLGFWPEGGEREFATRPFYYFFQKNEDERILANLMNFFGAVAERWPTAWASVDRGAMLNKTNGYNGLMRFFKNSYLNFATSPTVVSKSDFAQLLARSNLEDKDFNTTKFPPGSTGASKLYRELLESSGLKVSVTKL